MERKGNQFPALGICQRLFNIVFNSIAARGLKRITLGPPKALTLVEIPIFAGTYSSVKDEGSEDSPSSIATAGPPPAEAVDQVGDSGMSNGTPEVSPTPPPTANNSVAKIPRKIVSFNDEVEVRVLPKGKEKKKTSKEKLTQTTDPPRPLRPILRVASNIDEKSETYIRTTKEALSRSGSSTDPRE